MAGNSLVDRIDYAPFSLADIMESTDRGRYLAERQKREALENQRIAESRNAVRAFYGAGKSVQTPEGFNELMAADPEAVAAAQPLEAHFQQGQAEVAAGADAHRAGAMKTFEGQARNIMGLYDRDAQANPQIARQNAEMMHKHYFEYNKKNGLIPPSIPYEPFDLGRARMIANEGIEAFAQKSNAANAGAETSARDIAHEPALERADRRAHENQLSRDAAADTRQAAIQDRDFQFRAGLSADERQGRAEESAADREWQAQKFAAERQGRAEESAADREWQAQKFAVEQVGREQAQGPDFGKSAARMEQEKQRAKLAVQRGQEIPNELNSLATLEADLTQIQQILPKLRKNTFARPGSLTAGDNWMDTVLAKNDPDYSAFKSAAARISALNLKDRVGGGGISEMEQRINQTAEGLGRDSNPDAIEARAKTMQDLLVKNKELKIIELASYEDSPVKRMLILHDAFPGATDAQLKSLYGRIR